MKLYPYAIFDMDGTLVDSMTQWMLAPVEYVRTVLPDMTEEQAEQVYRTRTYEGMLRLLTDWGLSVTLGELMRQTELLMEKYYRDEVECKPGVRELLDRLRENGTRMGIVTMTPHSDVDICLSKTGLDKYFSFVLTPEDTSDGSGKEKPEIFAAALKKLGCPSPQDCMYFEDSLYAAETGRALGFHLIGVADRWADSERVREISEEFIDFEASAKTREK